MPKSDNLVALIDSLTPAEKKYFVQFTQLRSDDKSYVKLYKAVLNNGGYNAEKLSKQLSKTKANLAHEKQYLFENILKALRNYHDKQGSIELNNTMSDALLLKERGLNMMALGKMKKAEKLAHQYGKPEMEWRMLFDQRLLAACTYEEEEFLDIANDIMKQMQQVVERIDDFQTLQDFYLRVENSYYLSAHARSEKDIAQTQAMLNSPELKLRINDVLFKYFQLAAQSSLHQRLLNNEAAINCLRQCLLLAEKYPEQLSIDTHYYFLILNGYLIALLFAGKFKEFERSIKKIRTRYYHKLPFNHSYLDKILDAHRYYYYLIMYNFLLAKPIAPIQEIKSFLVSFEKKYDETIHEFPDEHAILLPHYATSICFVLKDFDSALKWNRKAINESTPRNRYEVLSIARMANVILHAEMKNYALLPALVNNTRRYLERRNFLSSVEKTTLSFLSKLPQLNNATQIKKAYSELFSTYKELEQTKEGAYHLRTFKYRLWAQRNM